MTKGKPSRAEKDGADYLSVSPVYATSTKPDHETPTGIEGTRKLVQRAGLPVVAIGGIDESNLAGLIECGIRGNTVVSAVAGLAGPEKKAGEPGDADSASRGIPRGG